MPITELNPQEFSKNLAGQAIGYVPDDFSEEHKNYIAKKVYEFCVITSEHLIKQHQEIFTDEEAVIVIQFIGEWTFHKSIDLIKADIDSQYWDQILQQVAFAALKSALHSHIEKFENDKTTAFIEHSVKKAYEDCINQLIKANAIEEEEAQDALSQSNVDKMTEKIKAETEANEAPSVENDEKTMKYVTIAMFLRKMPPQKAEKILQNMDEPERQKIRSCLQIKDLEQKLDASIINGYIQDLKKNISINSKPGIKKLIKAFNALQEEYGEESIINLTINERAKIQHFLSDCLFEDGVNALKVKLSPYITKILYNYLNNKLVA